MSQISKGNTINSMSNISFPQKSFASQFYIDKKEIFQNFLSKYLGFQ